MDGGARKAHRGVRRDIAADVVCGASGSRISTAAGACATRVAARRLHRRDAAVTAD